MKLPHPNKGNLSQPDLGKLRALDKIASTVTVWPHQLGWLRRRELDYEGQEVWELPDGRLYAHDGKQTLKLEVLRKL